MTETEEELIDGGKVMSLFDHLAELRSRIIRSLLTVMILFFASWGFADPILRFLSQPLLAALPKGANALHFTGPLDVFVVQLKVSAMVGVVLGCPVWLYQFWKFFEPALYPRERRYILPFIVVSVALFFAGVAFCFYFALPMALTFLIGMGLEIGTPIITIKDYISLLIIMIFGFGLIFETPVILILMAMLDLISAETLAEHRRLVVVLILVVAAVLTPPDPISQIAMAIPLYIMYELSIFLIRLIKGGDKKKETAIATRS